MKRFLLILILLLSLVMAYADGPRYRFKSRRALQSLWRKEMRENPKMYNHNGNARMLNTRERNGEGENERADKFQYGIVVADPFSNVKLGNMDKGNNDSEGNNGLFSSKIDKKKTDDGEIFKPVNPPFIDPQNPFVGGKTDPNKGHDDSAPPKPPVGDGLHILLILTAALIAIKKRLSK